MFVDLLLDAVLVPPLDEEPCLTHIGKDKASAELSSLLEMLDEDLGRRRAPDERSIL